MTCSATATRRKQNGLWKQTQQGSGWKKQGNGWNEIRGRGERRRHCSHPILKRQVQLSLRITFENIVVPVLDRDREIGVSEGVAFEFVAAGATVGDIRFIRSLVSVET